MNNKQVNSVILCICCIFLLALLCSSCSQEPNYAVAEDNTFDNNFADQQELEGIDIDSAMQIIENAQLNYDSYEYASHSIDLENLTEIVTVEVTRTKEWCYVTGTIDVPFDYNPSTGRWSLSNIYSEPYTINLDTNLEIDWRLTGEWEGDAYEPVISVNIDSFDKNSGEVKATVVYQAFKVTGMDYLSSPLPAEGTFNFDTNTVILIANPVDDTNGKGGADGQLVNYVKNHHGSPDGLIHVLCNFSTGRNYPLIKIDK